MTIVVFKVVVVVAQGVVARTSDIAYVTAPTNTSARFDAEGDSMDGGVEELVHYHLIVMDK